MSPILLTASRAFAIAALCLAGGNAAAQIDAPHITAEIRVDGLLNEPAWETAAVVDDFTQRELTEGAAPTEQTIVRVMASDTMLYIGALCRDSDPSGIIHRELTRDGAIGNDDCFAVVLDTYHDRRRGYDFVVNPNGAISDGIMQPGSLAMEWDPIWHAAAQITPEGWSCEMAIPFDSLRFPSGSEKVWGINFQRVIRRKNEEVLWRGWSRNAGITRLTDYGEMVFRNEAAPGLQLDVKPYLLGGIEKDAGDDLNDITRGGADLTFGIDSNTTLVLTANTDFAHIESDREVINLTRFDISYPEKRDFFLEGADTFDFTQGGTRLFYSRRIGITPDRRNQPIIGGAKLTRKAGSVRLGVLSVQTGDKYGFPGANYSAVRLKKDLWQQSYVGFIATSVFDGNNHDNQVLGVDGVFRTAGFMGDRNLIVQGYLAGSADDGHMADNTAGRVYIGYPNDVIDSYILYHYLDNRFIPGLGFASRVGIRNHIWYTTIAPRPNIPFIKKLVFKPFNYYMNTDMGTRMITRRIDVQPIGFITESDDEFSFMYRNEYDYVEQTYEMYQNVFIPQGPHDWWYSEAAFGSSRNRPVSISLSGRWGDYYHGSRTAWGGAISLKTGPHYTFSADASVSDIAFGPDRFTTREYGGHADIDISTRLSAGTFIQYNNATDEVITNVRLHYIPRAGSDVYIVYNHFLDEGDDFRTLRTEGMLKVDVTYRL